MDHEISSPGTLHVDTNMRGYKQPGLLISPQILYHLLDIFSLSELNNNWSEGDIKGINLTGRAMMTMRQYRSVILNHPIAAPYDFVHECDFQICGRKIEPV